MMLKDFHITEDQSVDIMHDVFETVASYVMRDLIVSKVEIVKIPLIFIVDKFSTIVLVKFYKN